MPASYTDWPVSAYVPSREQAERASHDAVPAPSKRQVDEWREQLEEELPLPFTDDEEGS